MNTTELEFEKPFIELERHLSQLNAFSETHPELDLTGGYCGSQTECRHAHKTDIPEFKSLG